MLAYVISKRGSEFLDTPVFQAGLSEKQEAIAVFTSEEAAVNYFNDVAWTEQNQVGTLTELQLVRWVLPDCR